MQFFPAEEQIVIFRWKRLCFGVLTDCDGSMPVDVSPREPLAGDLPALETA